jgi:hypothetical protein
VRRLIAATVLAVLAAPAGANALRLTSPSGYVAAHPHVSSVAAQLELRGRARRGAAVRLRVRCEIGPCSTTALADRQGRFSALLNVVLPFGSDHVRVRALSGARTWARSYPLDLPEYAAYPPYADDGPAPELNVIGDSLAVGTDPGLRMLLPGWRVTTDGRVSRPLAEGMTVLGMTPLPRRPRALAFSLFTNDDPRAVDALETAVRGSLDRLGPRDCALWATIVRPKLAGVSYSGANRRLLELAAQDERLLVVDWARAVRRHREWLRGDGVHPTPEGYMARSRLYARAAQLCAQQRRW